VDIVNVIVADAVGIAAFVPVMDKFIPVVAVQAIVRAKPQKPVPVLMYAVHRVLRQAIVYGEVSERKLILLCKTLQAG
jgi:hypothetical protein